MTHPNPNPAKDELQPYPTIPTGSRAVPNHAEPPLFTLHDPLGPPTLPHDMLPCPQEASASCGRFACQGPGMGAPRAPGWAFWTTSHTKKMKTDGDLEYRVLGLGLPTSFQPS